MAYESLILPAIIILMILFFVALVIPKLIKLTVALVMIYLLFHVGYIWTSQETSEYLHVDKWMNEEHQEKFSTFYDSFYEDRKENGGIVDVEKVKGMMDTTIDAARIDSSITDEEKGEIKEYWELIFKTLNSEEAQALLEKTKDSWSKVFTKEEMNEMIDDAEKNA